MELEQPVKKITLVQKLVISYAAIFFFTVAVLAISHTGLYSLTRTAREIVANDFVLINFADKLRESIIAQQSYAAKFAILKGPEFQDLYLQREAEFLEILHKTKRDRSLDEIAVAYRDFRDCAQRVFRGETDASPALGAAATKVTAALEKALVVRHALIDEKLRAAKEREKSTVWWTLLLSFAGFLLALGVATLLIFNISTAITKLKKATHRIAEGEFDFDPGIPAGDEVGDLAENFTRMARKLKELEQMSLDASPLTRLPGNIAIERVLEAKLAEETPFAVCYADLDYFKPYNDRYGYIQGSELLKKTGEIIYEAVNDCGGQDTFVGHVGGDDFVMVVTPEKAGKLCETVIERFDRAIPDFYTPDDRAKSGIEGVDRYGVHRSFPIMTISIAIVICRKGAYDSAVSIAKAAAEMKDNLKGKAGSNYSINKRHQPR